VRDQAILSIDDLSTAAAETLGNWPRGAALRLLRVDFNRFAHELTFSLRGRRSERGPWHAIGPHRFDDWLEDRHRNTAAGPAAT
jgi:hypothetical protein